jgi:hypothetical protein
MLQFRIRTSCEFATFHLHGSMKHDLQAKRHNLKLHALMTHTVQAQRHGTWLR